jgi:hypothetical protein
MTIRKRRLRVFIVWILSFGLCRVYAQSGQADVQGSVTDPTGSVVAGATITLTNSESGNKRLVITGSMAGTVFLQLRQELIPLQSLPRVSRVRLSPGSSFNWITM